MGLVHRFTRDSASKYVWGGLLLLAILGLVLTFTTGRNVVRAERLAAEERSVAVVEDVLEPRLAGVDLDVPLGAHDVSALRHEGRSVMVDERVARIRIWSPDGELRFSTERGEDIGSNAALSDELVGRAADGETLTRWNVSDVGGLDEAGRSLLRTYTPIGSGGVAEIDHTQDGTVGPVAASWLRHQLLAGAFVAIFLGMTILALRDPVGRINTGVPFAASAVPAGYSLIDEERLHAVEEVYRRAHERVARLEAQLSESEGLRRHLEGDLQRALSTASTGSGTTSPATAAVQPAVALAEQQPAAPVSRPPATRPPMAPNTIVTVPRSEVLGESWTAAAVTAEAAIPTKPKRHLLKRKAEPVAGAVTTAPATDPGVEDATAHEAVLETFIRLTESDRQSHEAGPVDAGAVRAALARTAARKKPGGTKLQPHEEPKEVRGGGPRREDG